MKGIALFLIGCVVVLPAALYSQNDTTIIRLDTVPPGPGDTLVQSQVDFPDSTIALPRRKMGRLGRFFLGDYPDPGKAALFSLVLPGAGQVYNKKWWKLPIVYGGLGTLVWLEVSNVKIYREARQAYEYAVDEDPNTNPTGIYANREPAVLRDYRDTYRRYVELTSLGLFISYLAVAADAYVDAHLSRFDVSEDISLRLHADPAPGGPVVGLGLTVPLGR